MRRGRPIALLALSVIVSSSAFQLSSGPLAPSHVQRLIPRATRGTLHGSSLPIALPMEEVPRSGQRHMCGGITMMARRGASRNDGTRYETISSGLRRPEQWRKEGEENWKRGGGGASPPAKQHCPCLPYITFTCASSANFNYAHPISSNRSRDGTGQARGARVTPLVCLDIGARVAARVGRRRLPRRASRCGGLRQCAAA